MGWFEVYPGVIGCHVFHFKYGLLQLKAVDVSVEVTPALLSSRDPVVVDKPISDHLKFDDHIIWWCLHISTKFVLASIALLDIVPSQEAE